MSIESTAETQGAMAGAEAETTIVTDVTPSVSAPELKKKDLIDAVVERSGVKKKFAKPAIEAMMAIMGEALAEGREMNLQPLGKIKINRIKAVNNGKVVMTRIRQSDQALEAASEEEAEDS